MKYTLIFEVCSAALFGILGAFCLFFPNLSAESVFYGAAVLTTLSALSLWFHFLRGKKRGIQAVLALAATVLACLFWSHKATGREFIILVFAIYMVACGAMELVQFYLDMKDQAENSWTILISGLVYGILGFMAWRWRVNDVNFIVRLMGMYLLYQALELLIELFWYRHPNSARNASFRLWCALPCFIVGELPSIVLRFMLSKKLTTVRQTYDQRKNDEPVNLKVFIHSGISGDKVFGHMTFSYKGVMYSYGNYDKAEEKFFRSIGPGLFFTVPSEVYVNNSCLIEGSTLFEFGLHLNEAQEARLEEILQGVFQETYRWYSPIEKEGEGRFDFEKYKDDYACRLTYYTGAKFRKFYRGPWKTYWILGDNCSMFAEDILSKIGCHIVHKSGIVSPGEYFEFFAEAFQDPDSNVVYRSWHDARFPDTLYPTLA